MRIRSAFLAAAAFAAFAPRVASAQAGVVTLSLVEGETASFSQAQCVENKPKTIRYECAATGVEFAVFLSSGSCQDAPADGAVKLVANTTLTVDGIAGTKEVMAQDVAGGSECPNGTTKEVYVCAVARYKQQSYYGGNSDWQVYDRAELVLRYDTEAPSMPKIVEAVGGERNVHLSWEGSSDVDDWVACYEPIGEAPPVIEDPCAIGTKTSAMEGEDGGVVDETDAGIDETDAGIDETDAGIDETDAGIDETDAGIDETDAGIDETDAGIDETDAGTDDGGTEEPTVTPAELLAACTNKFVFDNGEARKGTISGLNNLQTYRIKLFAIDEAGNVSAPSPAMDATPQLVFDFYEQYRCQGGTEEGGFGCSAAGMTLLPVAGLAVLGLLRRRRGTRSAE